MRYNRGSAADTMRAAAKFAARHGATVYVFATAFGMRIERQAPPFNQAHMIVEPDGSQRLVEWQRG